MHQITFVTLSQDVDTRYEIRSALASDARARLLAECSSPEEVFNDIKRLSPSAVVISLRPDHLENSLELIRRLVAVVPGVAVITASRDASPTTILGCLRAGAREFLQLPSSGEELRTVLDRIVEFCEAQESASRKGRIVACFSGKGGTGVSFFATNLAAVMNSPTLFLDLNLQAGDAASFLGLTPKYSIIDLVRNRRRLDDALVTSLLTPHTTNLSLVAAPFETHEAEEVTPQDTTEILHLLAQKFEHVVIDLPHTFDPVTLAALDLADDILLLLTLDIPGIRSTKRALKVFEHLGYPRQKIRVVVNRWSKNVDIELHKIEAHLGEQLVGFIPNDYRKAIESINLGRPMVQTEPTSKIALEIKRIASLVSERTQTPSTQPRKRLLGSVFGRQTPTKALQLSVISDNV